METSLTQAFEFQGHKLQVIIHNDKIAFIGNELCAALGYKNARAALAKLPDHQKDDVAIRDAIGRLQNTNIVYEGGVYRLIFGSRLPNAEAFTDLVTDVILPTIRKTGTYTAQVPIAAQRPAAPFKTLDEALSAEPRCPCPTDEQAKNAIVATVQRLQPFFTRGITGATLIQYSEAVQSYEHIHGCGALLVLAEALTEQQILLRSEHEKAYYYTAPQVAGYLH